ncbi:hypothetical protein [Eubacterium sp. 1001713B170207_170306_E7]|uniref:hypothetical protein n=1 Tax=Eubacterium sp. 1001713B170207_170306_E7 TaxID=2787097 RepID=UPI00189A908E|nr:hypothetical protein [Eubacterium sp. 1001713B170207_170306_E7]
MAAICQQTIYPVKKVNDFFWAMFIVDALIGNFDRHNGNWGFLINEKDTKAKIAPVYDCGSCLYPKLSDAKMEKMLKDKEEIRKRVYDFPNSAIKENGKKINYFSIINNLKYKDCNEALSRMMDRIDMNEIKKFIDTVPNISNIRRRFYKTLLTLRYDLILCSSFLKLNEQQLITDQRFIQSDYAHDDRNER